MLQLCKSECRCPPRGRQTHLDAGQGSSWYINGRLLTFPPLCSQRHFTSAVATRQHPTLGTCLGLSNCFGRVKWGNRLLLIISSHNLPKNKPQLTPAPRRTYLALPLAGAIPGLKDVSEGRCHAGCFDDDPEDASAALGRQGKQAGFPRDGGPESWDCQCCYCCSKTAQQCTRRLCSSLEADATWRPLEIWRPDIWRAKFNEYMRKTSTNDIIRCVMSPYSFTRVRYTGSDLGHLVNRNWDAVDGERGQLWGQLAASGGVFSESVLQIL